MMKKNGENSTCALVVSSIVLLLLSAVSGCDSIKGLAENQQQKVQEAYITYFNAIQAGDITALRKLVAKEKAKEIESPDAAGKLAMIKALYPEQSRVTAVNIAGDSATINLAGTSQGGNVQGTVQLVREDGLWKVSRENWEMKFGMQEEKPAPPPAEPAQQPAQTQPSSAPSPFSKQDPGVTGEAVVVKDGKTETYPVRTGFFSDTRMAQPTRAVIQFQFPGGEHSNARRIELTLDATKTGAHFADGKMLSENFMSSDKIKIGERISSGYTASFRWVADGGQIFFPKTSCTITVTSPYTGTPNSVFSGEVRDCPVHSAGIDYTINSARFVMRGAPSR